MWFTKYTRQTEKLQIFFVAFLLEHLFATCSHYSQKPDKMISPIKSRLIELKRRFGWSVNRCGMFFTISHSISIQTTWFIIFELPSENVKCISFKCIGMLHLESRHCLYNMCNIRSLALHRLSI